MISIKQTLALHAIVIYAALTISAVPSPHAYAQLGQDKCLSTQTPSTGGHNTAQPPPVCNPSSFQKAGLTLYLYRVVDPLLMESAAALKRHLGEYILSAQSPSSTGYSPGSLQKLPVWSYCHDIDRTL